MTIIMFFVAAMNNKAIPMDIANQTFAIKSITPKNRTQTQIFLDEYFKKNPKSLQYIKAGSLVDYLCWKIYTKKDKRHRMVKSLSSNENNLNILNKKTNSISCFVNMQHETHIENFSFRGYTTIKNLIYFNYNKDTSENLVNFLINELFKNKEIDVLEYSGYKPHPFTSNGFTTEGSYLGGFYPTYYSLTREDFENRKSAALDSIVVK